MRNIRPGFAALLLMFLSGCAVDFSELQPMPALFGEPTGALRQKIVETAMAAAPRFSSYRPTVEEWFGGFDSDGHPIISGNSLVWAVRLRPQAQPVKKSTFRRATICCMTLPMTPPPVDGEVVVMLSGGFKPLGVYRFK